ncbi:hypothetical protein [Falsiroseomonas sp. HW251]|uniref:hypothetical protein n=1 Tax=Falsiroseomonas sp. HW251 TaxID=3390998 RepID=UPI003D3190E1
MRRRARSRRSLAWAMLLMLGTWLSPAQAAGRLPTGLGIHVQVWHIGPADLERIRALGIGFVRWGIAWDAVETAPGRFDWSGPDAFIERLGRVGLGSMVILGTGNPLYSPMLDLPPHPGARWTRVAAPPGSEAERAAFARFAAAAAARYAAQGVTWEIWNEPDSRIFWPPAPQPDAYAQLVEAACHAIKAAAPDAAVLAPATAALPHRAPQFFYSLSRTGALDCLDGLSAHSYRIQGGVQPDPESVAAENATSRGFLDRLSPRARSLPMLSTEWGYPSSVVGAASQAAYLARTYLANLASGVSATVWYEWKDSRDEPLNPESHFGLVAANGEPKAGPDSALFPRLLRLDFVRRLETGDPLIQALLFRDDGVEHVVAWLRSADPGRTLRAEIGGTAVTLGIVPTILRGDRIAVSGRGR